MQSITEAKEEKPHERGMDPMQVFMNSLGKTFNERSDNLVLRQG